MTCRLSIVSLNTWKCDGRYRDRLRWMADGLTALAPDVLCLQEAFDCPDAAADTAGFLADALGMVAHTLPSRRKPRMFEGALRDSWSNLAILSRHPVRRAGDIALPGHADDADRRAMQIDIEHSDGPPFRVINTHLTHLRSRCGDALRQRQAELLAARIQSAPGNAAILCGDLNAAWGSDALAPLRRLDWQCPGHDRVQATLQGERPGTNREAARIDHILARNGRTAHIRLRSLKPALNTPVGDQGEYPSDHAAILADVELTPIMERTA